MRQRPLCSGGRFCSRVELSCTVVGALLCSVLLCSALLSVLYTALHCCQSRRRRQVSLCPRERELPRSAVANFARPSAEQRGRRENRAALLVASCTKSGRAEWTGELDGRWWEVGDGRRAPQIPGLSPPQCTRPPICTPSDPSCLLYSLTSANVCI